MGNSIALLRRVRAVWVVLANGIVLAIRWMRYVSGRRGVRMLHHAVLQYRSQATANRQPGRAAMAHMQTAQVSLPQSGERRCDDGRVIKVPELFGQDGGVLPIPNLS
ncbi:hypothetical protein PTKU64_90370 (plasmid) [Paraburkholderia terrae]|uniref:Secreted protein n=1 Tax=Paraburkholderia terrae TaxID=311230 RepID=A0ABM7U293_9BURK|nr:hypothetical protein PTKU64_90370 [Paraburkholderia terrae]